MREVVDSPPMKRTLFAPANIRGGGSAAEGMAQDLASFGFDANTALSVDVPGKVCAYLASHPTPMVFSGRTIDAPWFAVDAGLIDGKDFPPPYGPSHWGLPRG